MIRYRRDDGMPAVVQQMAARLRFQAIDQGVEHARGQAFDALLDVIMTRPDLAEPAAEAFHDVLVELEDREHTALVMPPSVEAAAHVLGVSAYASDGCLKPLDQVLAEVAAVLEEVGR